MVLIETFLLFTVVSVNSEIVLKCQNSIKCPCGNTRENVSVCVSDASFYAEACTRLSKCQRCEEGSHICSECPEGFEGPFCTLYKGVRSCPILDTSDLGSFECVRISSEEEICTGKCRPDHYFSLFDFEDEINLKCYKSEWTPADSFPKCKKNPVEEVIYCRDPGFNANSVRQSSTPLIRCRFPQGCRLMYSCVHGYQLQGERSLLCMPSGEWSASLPTCVAQSTTTAGTSDTGSLFCRDPGIHANSFRRSSTLSTCRGFPECSQMEYSCDHGYGLKGERSLFCLSSGEWSASVPRCVETNPTTPDTILLHCPDPGMNANGHRRTSTLPTPRGFIQGSGVFYYCDQGYNMIGEHRLFCLSSGNWTANIPKCVSQSKSADESQDKNECDKRDEMLCMDWDGGYKCMHYTCPPDYFRDLQNKNLCIYVDAVCLFNDLECLSEPKKIEYRCITLKSNQLMPPSGQMYLIDSMDLSSSDVKYEFVLTVKDVKAPDGVIPATRDHFQLIKISDNIFRVSLIKRVQGPQEIELNFITNTFRNGKYLRNTMVKYFIFVSEF